MEEIRGPAGRTMWDKLANVNETVLANYLKNEYPQTVSVVLSKIKPEHAARVLTALPEEFALEVVQRMLRMESVQKDILDKVEGEEGLFELRLDNTPNNPRVLLCSAKGRQIVLLHAFKKKGRSLPAREIAVAKHRREHWLAGERNDTVEKDA